MLTAEMVVRNEQTVTLSGRYGGISVVPAEKQPVSLFELALQTGTTLQSPTAQYCVPPSTAKS